MRKSVKEYLVGRNYDFDVLENGVPEALVGPSVDVIQPREKFDLHITDLRFDIFELLRAKSYCGSQKPDEFTCRSSF
jgi:hypothetical protein